MNTENVISKERVNEAESGAADCSRSGLECADFQEHPGWRNNPDKTTGVTWDAWCSMCGFRLENKPWASGLTIEGEGRRLAHVGIVAIIGGERFTSNKRKIVCSKCCPVILGRYDD